MNKKRLLSVFAVLLIFGSIASVSSHAIQNEANQIDKGATVTDKEIKDTEYNLLEEKKTELEQMDLDELSMKDYEIAIQEQKQLMQDYADYYDVYGWEKYAGEIFTTEALLLMTKDDIDAIEDILYQVENDVFPVDEERTKEDVANFLKEKLVISQEFLDKLEEEPIIKKNASKIDTKRELSGEYQLLYYLPENRERLAKHLK